MMLGTLGCPKHYIETVSINTFQSSGSDLPPWLAVTSQGFFVFCKTDAYVLHFPCYHNEKKSRFKH